eukprot:s586_g11.t1
MPLLQDVIELMTLRERSHRPRALQAANHEWFHGTTDAELPASTLQGLVGCAAGHQVTEELAIRLGEANTLNALRQLMAQFQQFDRALAKLAKIGKRQGSLHCVQVGKQGIVEDGVAYELLLRHAVPAKVAQRCLESCGRDFPYVALMNDILASKERSLSVDELRGLIGGGVFQLSGPDDIEQLLSWMDVNQDGNVSFEEFLNVALEYGQISSRAESDEASTSFWAGLGLRPARMEANGGQSFPKQLNPPAQDPRVWKLRVGILSAEGAPFIDPMQFHSAYVICSLCGEDPQSDAVELFRTHNVSYTGQASWNIEEDLLDYQPPDGLELSIVCQGAGKPDWLLGSARLQHRQFFPLGCNTRLTLVRGGEGIQGTLWVKILVMEDNGTPVSEGPLQDASSAQWVGGAGKVPNAAFVKTNGDGNKFNPGCLPKTSIATMISEDVQNELRVQN